MSPSVHRPARALAWLALAACCAGCGSRGHERYVPSPEQARQALDASLDAWKNGDPPGRIDSLNPPVEVVDSHRRPGQKLRAYTVLGETAGTGPRVFAVR